MRFKNHLQRLSVIPALKSFFFGLKPVFSWTSINCFHVFLRASLFVFVRGGTVKTWKNLFRMTKAFQIRWDDLHTVSCNNISFLNTRSQLVWVLASSVWQFWRLFETWRMIKISAAYKIYFHTVFTFWKKTPLFLGVIFYISSNLYSLCFHTII